jgi:hypothetical protein
MTKDLDLDGVAGLDGQEGLGGRTVNGDGGPSITW